MSFNRSYQGSKFLRFLDLRNQLHFSHVYCYFVALKC